MCTLPLHTPHFEASWWQLGDVVTIKIEEHQRLGSRECLRMNGLDCIALQTDALNLWNCSQSVGFQVCDTVLTLTQQDYIRYQPAFIWKESSSVIRGKVVCVEHAHLIWGSRHHWAGQRGRHEVPFYDSWPPPWLKQTRWSIYRCQDSRTHPGPSTIWSHPAIFGTTWPLDSQGCSERLPVRDFKIIQCSLDGITFYIKH